MRPYPLFLYLKGSLDYTTSYLTAIIRVVLCKTSSYPELVSLPVIGYNARGGKAGE